MNVMSSRRGGVVAAVAVLALASACSDDDGGTVVDTDVDQSQVGTCDPGGLPLKTAGKLTVGTDDPAYEPWFAEDDPSSGKGFESAVAYAVAGELGLDAADVTWVKVPFNTSYQPGEKAFDFDINQISITVERERAVDFSVPYYEATQAIIMLKDSGYVGATSLAELKDARLGAQVGTTSLDAISQISPDVDPLVYDDTTKAAQALEDGQADGIVADLPSAYYLASSEIAGATIVGQFQPRLGVPEEFGLLLEKGSNLTPCVDAALTSLSADGTLARLEKEWLAEATDVPELD